MENETVRTNVNQPNQTQVRNMEFNRQQLRGNLVRNLTQTH